MTSLNHIPDSLRSPDPPEWTPGQGLRRGTIRTILAAVVLAALMGLAGRYVPMLTLHMLPLAACGFVVAWTLFAVMHRTSGMTSLPGTLIVIACSVLVISVKHCVILWAVAQEQTPPTSVWALYDTCLMAAFNWPAWVGIGGATAMCKDGDGILLDVADILMTNPFVGRRG